MNGPPIEDGAAPTPAPARRPLAVALAAAILLLAALLLTFLVLPLLGRSPSLFFLVSGSCWLAIFGVAAALTRSLTRSGESNE
jgi:hypothetical protein